jgi:hypothetical protein
MTDDEFLAALESGALPETEFRHASHVRAAYLYLTRHGFAEGLAHMTGAIRGFAAAKGKAGLYHETITVAFVALIHEHMHVRGPGGGWEDFARANPELLDKRILSHFYGDDALRSARARAVFVLPRPAPPALA